MPFISFSFCSNRVSRTRKREFLTSVSVIVQSETKFESVDEFYNIKTGRNFYITSQFVTRLSHMQTAVDFFFLSLSFLPLPPYIILSLYFAYFLNFFLSLPLHFPLLSTSGITLYTKPLQNSCCCVLPDPVKYRTG
jgi:hypothetical protein